MNAENNTIDKGNGEGLLHWIALTVVTYSITVRMILTCFKQ